jgi:molecular chaperone DnaJ
MTVDDAYAELGLPPGAGLNQAKVAWRGLVSRWHPDRNEHAGASARMQRINQALAKIRSATPGQADAAPETWPEPPAPTRPEPEPVVLRTVARQVRLTLEEAALGCIKTLSGAVVDPCGVCSGTGTLKPQACAACEGQGKVRASLWFGWYGPGTACAACEGSGTLRPACPGCEGSGKTEVARYRMSVRMPPGVRGGDTLQAHPDRVAAGVKVVLDIRVELLPHERLALDEDGSIRCELPVDGFRWIANRSVEVPTLQGPKRMSLRSGQVMYRLLGKGFPVNRKGERADQIVIIVPRFPAELSPKQERLLDQLAATTAAQAEVEKQPRNDAPPGQ